MKNGPETRPTTRRQPNPMGATLVNLPASRVGRGFTTYTETCLSGADWYGENTTRTHRQTIPPGLRQARSTCFAAAKLTKAGSAARQCVAAAGAGSNRTDNPNNVLCAPSEEGAHNTFIVAFDRNHRCSKGLRIAWPMTVASHLLQTPVTRLSFDGIDILQESDCAVSTRAMEDQP